MSCDLQTAFLHTADTHKHQYHNGVSGQPPDWSTTIPEKKKLNFSQVFLIYFGLFQYVPVFYGLI